MAQTEARQPMPDVQGCFALNGDAAYSYIQGRMIARGHWFIDSAGWMGSFIRPRPAFMPSSGKPPIFALFLGAISRLGLTSATSQRLALCVVGVIGVILIVTLSRRLAGPRAALIAGAIAAVYPMLWINDGMMTQETLYVPLVLLAMHAAYSFWDRPGFRTAAIMGATAALAALSRAEAVLLLGLLPLPLAWGLRRFGWRSLLKWVATSWLVGALLISPWLAFNLTRFHNPAFMTSATGAVLSSANCDITYDTDSIGYWGNCFDEYIQKGQLIGKVPTCDAAAVEGALVNPKGPEAEKCWPNDPAYDETDRDKISQELAIDYMMQHKRQLPLVMAARVGRMLDIYTPDLGRDDEPLGQNVRFNWQVEGRGKRASEIGLLMYWGLLPFCIAGTVVLWRRRIPISPLMAMVVVITSTAALTFGITRYRVPLDVIVVILAAVAIDALIARRWTLPWRATITRRRGDSIGERLSPNEPTDSGLGERVDVAPQPL